MLHKATIFIILTTIMLTISCSGGEMEQKKVTYNSLKDIPDAAWEKLSPKKIFFGHQSVGFNIIDGIQDLMKEYPQIKLNIVETSDSKKFNSGIFAHSRVGKNTEPDTKIADFAKYIDQGIGENADAAFLKFCYVDMLSISNAQQVFDEYAKAMQDLKDRHRDLAVIHFTVPLTTNEKAWKLWIKNILGRKDIQKPTDNMRRNQYNELLIEKYKGKEPVFDIANLESTYPDGSRSTFAYEGKTYYSLVPEYTDDGGHLNAQGRKRVAAQLLITLINEI